jgi:general secretion pathway protein G
MSFLKKHWKMTVFIAVLILIAGSVALNFLQTENRRIVLGNRNTASIKLSLREISLQLFNFKKDCGFFPSTQQGLRALYTNSESEPTCQNWKGPYPMHLVDSWGTDFIYISGGQTFTLKSLGRDKKEGGIGYDADIVVDSSQLPEASNSK